MWLFIVAIVVLILIIVKSNWYKGVMGERSVNKVLRHLAKTTGGLEMTDFMLRDDRSSSQIDNMLLTQKAFYVIEMKNYKGMIFGSPDQLNWTMTVKHVNKKQGKGGKIYKKTHVSKHSFYNPIKQNQTHINKINNLTNIKDILPIYNIVVFGKKAQLRYEGHKQRSHVVSIRKLKGLIESLEREHQTAIPLSSQIEVIDTLYALNITDKKQRRAHVKNLKMKYSR